MNERLRKSTLIGIATALHDVGKVAQRANNELSSKHKDDREQILTGYSHYHALHTADILEKFFYNEYQKISDEWQNAFPETDLIHTSATHHNPANSNFYARIIQEADCLAAGHDRNRNIEERNNSVKYKEVALLPILNNIRLKNSEPVSHYRLKTSSFSLNNFNPVSEYKATAKDYSLLLQSLDDGIKLLVSNYNKDNNDTALSDFAAGLDTLLFLNMCNIPSSGEKSYDDVSLYDHLKVSAAFSATLYNYHVNNKENLKDRGIEKFLLIRGEFFSIQKFIFNNDMNSTNSAKILRGKSFYVSLLTEIASAIILDELDLPTFNLMLNAAGQFVILADNSEDNLLKLENIKQRINDWLYEKFSAQVSFGLSYIKITPNDCMRQKFHNSWVDLLTVIDKEKFQKFNLLDRRPDFDGYSSRFKKGACSVCGIEPATRDTTCDNCSFYEELGRKLTTAESIYFYKSEKEIFRSIGFKFEDKSILKNDYFGTIDINLNDKFKGSRIVNYKCYVDMCNGNISTFEDLAQKSDGAPLLGVLKADIDNLGAIFALGLEDDEENLLTFSRLNAMSRDINLFFSYYLGNMIEREKLSIYTVFAGGDDLFLVGAYSDIVKLAFMINDTMHNFTHNKEITLSAGVGFFSPSTPIWFIAEEVERLLSYAKSAGRNRIALFESVSCWDDFKTMQQNFHNITFPTIEGGSKKVNTSLFYKLLEFADMQIDYQDKVSLKKKGKTIDSLRHMNCLMWRPRLKYLAAKNALKEEEVIKITSMIETDPKLFKAITFLEIYKNREAK